MFQNNLTELDKNFRKELQDAFIQTRAIILNKNKESDHAQELEKIANHFYGTFQNSAIPVRPPQLELYEIEEFVSTSIVLSFSCFMVPYFFYEALKEDISFDLDSEFALQISWYELLGIINQKWLLQRKKLTKTDVLICKVLSKYGTRGQLDKFPLSYNIIANRTRKSFSIVKESIRKLFLRIVVNEFFLLNPWKLGWEIFLCSYNFSKDSTFSEFDSLTLSKEICTNDRGFRIIQVPRIGTEKTVGAIKSKIQDQNGSIYQINSLSFHWEISQLDSKEQNSFLHPPEYSPFSANLIHPVQPNVVFTYEKNSIDWLYDLKQAIQRFIANDKSLANITKEPNFAHQKIDELTLQKVLKILNYLIEYGIQLRSFDVTANFLQIPERELSKIIQFLVKKEVIALAHRFRFIGAGNEYAFIVENGSKELNEKIHQTLLQYPFSYVYQTEKLIAGRCQVPNQWSHKFFELFTRLQLSYKELNITYGQRILGYSFFNPNVKLPSNYILNEFGMKEQG